MNNLDLNLKDTFDFIHNILQDHYVYAEQIGDAIETDDKQEILECFDYYNDDEERQRSLILLKDSIRYVTCSAYGDNYITLTNNLKGY